MKNPRFVRLARLLVVASLASSALLLSAPVSPAAAARPVCATSKKADIERAVPLGTDSPRRLWTRVCVENGSLNVSVRQKNLGLGQKVEQSIDAELKIVVYSTTSNGRFLKDVEFEQVVSLGDMAVKFSSGAANKYGSIRYLPSLEGPSVTLPALRPGVYQVGFETVFYPAEQRPGDPTAPVTTGVRYLKFKV